MSDLVRPNKTTTLSDAWGLLQRHEFELRRRNGEWQHQVRETYDRGDGAAVLLLDLSDKPVILTRQFRYPAFVNGHPSGMLIEAAAGRLDRASPEERIRAEAEEETGYQVSDARRVFEAFMSPGSVTERVHFFVAEYDNEAKTRPGGGNHAEGEDIEVLEIPFAAAMRAIEAGEIQDGKTIMLLQYAFIHLFPAAATTPEPAAIRS